MPWRPPSREGKSDAKLDEPHSGLPRHLKVPVLEWLDDRISTAEDAPQMFLLDMRLERRHDTAVEDFRLRTSHSAVTALDAIDWCLFRLDRLRPPRVRTAQCANELEVLLSRGGSVWAVGPRQDEGDYRLTRRATGPVVEAIETLAPASRAHAHLVSAWNRSMGRDPDPSIAYREAVRAVEAAGRPVILPAASRATLGTMIAALRDAPAKWTTTTGSVDQVRELMRTLWTEQVDRHGTDDEDVPLNVTQEEAEVATHYALLLVRLLVRGDLRRVEEAAPDSAG